MWKFDHLGNMYWEPSTRFSRVMGRVNKKDGEDGGDGGKDNGGKTPEQLFQEKLDAAILPFKTQNQTLLDEKKKLAAAEKIITDLGGPEKLAELRAFKDKIAGDEILKLASEGKHDEAIKKATEHLELKSKAEREALSTELENAKKEGGEYKEQLRKVLVDSSITRGFIEAKGLDTAVPDVLFRAQSEWTVENGVAVARDKDGNLIQGKAGAITPKEWCENLRQTAPHLFPQSAGVRLPGQGGDDNVDNFGALLVEAGKKGPEALRIEKARQAELKAKAKGKR